MSGQGNEQIDRLSEQVARIAEQVPRLTDQQEAARKRHHETANGLQSLLLGNAEIRGILREQNREAEAQKRTLDKVDHAISGTAEYPGLIGRVDRLETTVGDWKKTLGNVVKAVIVLIVMAGGAGAVWVITQMHK